MPKILSIDDEPSITKLLVLLLGSYGINVITANHGEQGVQMVRTEAPELVLLDLMMPDMSGMEVARAIRSFSDIPILAFSAMNDTVEIANALKSGIDDYLEKPSSGETLVERINTLIKAHQEKKG
jgi:DNA-binding response OmpR family regulator